MWKWSRKNVRLLLATLFYFLSHGLHFTSSPNHKWVLVFLVRKEVASLSFLGFMSNPQLNTAFPTSNTSCFKSMDALWTSAKYPALFLFSKRFQSQIFPRLGLLKQSSHFMASRFKAISREFHLPNFDLNREALPLFPEENALYTRDSFTVMVTWGMVSDDTSRY